ncbi:hypothetical protein IE53DRAFT_122155 [Violaceomyces palustris]|uniref:Uncharacterized protein n=1 Tax=Violaceomyces palustris TaxID=1673888 RepID=A0ACD0NVU7_9BASI|nr:hypothetical protein IE53DRAFT_122155 [Violaceomyces palustris]
MPSQLEHHESAPFDIAGTGLPMRDHPNPFSASAPASQPSPSKLKVKPIFVKGQPPNLTTFKVHVMETFSYAKEKELRTLIRRHGGETEPHFAKADIVILDISNPIKGRKLYREARTLERPIPVVTAKWVYESSQKGEMADYTDPTFDPTVVLDKNGSLVKPTSSAASPISSSSIGRNPYTAEDRAFIVAHLARTRKPWSILSIAKQLASLRPDHTWQSYQTFLSSNLKHKWNLAQEVERYLKKPPAEGAPTPSAAPKLDVSENSSRGSIQNRIQAGSPSIGDGEEPSDVCNSSTKHVEPDGDGKSETNQEHKVDEARSDERNASSAAGKDGQGQNASQRLDGHVSGSGIEVREGTHADENQRGGEELEGENRKQAEGRGYMPEKKNGPVMDKGSETDARLISASSEHQGENSDDAAVEKQVIQENETAVDGCSDPEARAKVLEDPNHGKGLVDDNIQAGEPTDVTSGETERDPSDEAGERQHRNEMVGDERDELAPGESEEERGEDEDEDEDEEDELEIKAPRPAPTVTNSTFAAANASKETYHTEADNRFDGPSQVDHLASHEQGRAASTESRLDETSSKTQRTGPGRSAGEIPLHADGNEMVRVPGVSSPPPLEESEPEDGWGEGDEDLEESSSPEQARVVTSKSGDKDGNRNRHASPEGVLPTKSGDIRPVKRRSRRSQKSKKPEYDSDSSWNGRERRRLAAKASKEAGDQGK